MPTPLAAALAQVLLVANSISGTVSVVATAGFTRVCEIDVAPDRAEREAEWTLVHRLVNWYTDLHYVDDLALSADGRTLFVSRGSLADVAAFDVATGALQWRVPVDGLRADHLVLAPDGDRLYVSVITAGEIDVIDTRARRIVGVVPTGSQPHGLELSQDGSRLYVGERRGAALLEVDTATLAVLRRVPFAAGVRPFTVTRDGRRVFAQLSNYQGYVEYDLGAGGLPLTFDLPENARSKGYGGSYPKDAAHHGISLAPDEQTLCIAGTAADYAALVRLPDHAVTAIVPVGAEPSWSLIGPDGQFCYVSSRGSDTVSQISLATHREIARVPVGRYPQRMILATPPRICTTANGRQRSQSPTASP